MLQDLYQFICYVYIEKYGPIYKRRAMLLASTSTKMFVSSRIRLSLRGSYARLRDTMHNPETLYVNSVRPTRSKLLNVSSNRFIASRWGIITGPLL